MRTWMLLLTTAVLVVALARADEDADEERATADEAKSRSTTISSEGGSSYYKDGVRVDKDGADEGDAAGDSNAEQHMRDALNRLPENVRRFMDPNFVPPSADKPHSDKVAAAPSSPPSSTTTAANEDDGGGVPNVDRIMDHARQATERAMEAGRAIEERIEAIRRRIRSGPPFQSAPPDDQQQQQQEQEHAAPDM